MFEVGAKIDFWHFYVQSRSQNRSVTILNLYRGGGRGLHRFSPLHPCLDRCLDRRLDRRLDRCLDPRRSLCPSIELFRKILGILEKFMNRTSEKSAFPYWNLVHSSISWQFQPPSSKKSENQKILYSPVGEKKTTEFVPPPKESFGKSKAVYVRSRSQNRCLTILCSNQEPKSVRDHFEPIYGRGEKTAPVFPPPSMSRPMSRPPSRPPSRPM